MRAARFARPSLILFTLLRSNQFQAAKQLMIAKNISPARRQRLNSKEGKVVINSLDPSSLQTNPNRSSRYPRVYKDCPLEMPLRNEEHQRSLQSHKEKNFCLEALCSVKSRRRATNYADREASKKQKKNDFY
eukprot:TRINITY_DN12901_c0_g1_i1.p2 TRINITY_DN12901_c0_g1~~TRINITY_DN12901_c0_g1_i1.p2  ORF type:complete len:132 (-),score=16.89 TRINITY_DN12901_c0_g1_i1:32-427(-)